MKYLIGIILLTAIYGCIGESDELIKKKLHVILKDDLKSIINDLPEKSVADSAYYTIELYKNFKELKYKKKAVVNFFILKGVEVKIVRKYRYYKDYRKWERYFNEYRFYTKRENG